MKPVFIAGLTRNQQIVSRAEFINSVITCIEKNADENGEIAILDLAKKLMLEYQANFESLVARLQVYGRKGVFRPAYRYVGGRLGRNTRSKLVPNRLGRGKDVV